jgi:hypothetical protein
MLRAISLTVMGLVLAGVTLGQEAEGPAPAGTWKITLPLDPNFGDKALWLVKLERKDGKWAGRVLAHAEGFPETSLESLAVGKDKLRFTLKLPRQVFPFEFQLPGEKSAKLYGVLKRSGNLNPAEMYQTTLTSLDPFDLLKETLATRKDSANVIRTTMTLLSMASEKKAKPEEVRSWAARAVKAAEAYGPGWQRDVLVSLVNILADQPGYETIALTYARQGERMLEDKDRPGARKRVLDALAAALAKAGKADEAKEVEARAKKIDLTIKPTPFAGRQGKSDRVVLVELFTGAQCPPCVAADLAYDALARGFKPSEVVRLQYHVHIPGPDPLANPDDEARFLYYRLEGAPSILFNGRPAASGGGGETEGWDKYDEYAEEVEPLLEESAKASLKLKANRKESKVSIDVSADVQANGDNLRLRVALVEDEVAYAGRNKIAEHHNVVRAFAGGPDGEKVARGKVYSKTFTVDLDDLRKSLKEYLDKTNKDTPFPGKDRPLELKKLRVIAFVQNDATREVLQAAQVDIE